MWLIDVVCSDPDCGEEMQVLVEELHEAERVVCDCEHCVVVLSVSHFEPIQLDHLAPAELAAV